MFGGTLLAELPAELRGQIEKALGPAAGVSNFSRLFRVARVARVARVTRVSFALGCVLAGFIAFCGCSGMLRAVIS